MKITSRHRIFSICQPRQVELRERQHLGTMFLTTLIETAYTHVRGNTEIGIRRGTSVQNFSTTPTLTLIITDTDCHPLTTLAGGVREQDAVLVVLIRIRIPHHARLTNRFNKVLLVTEFRKCIATIAAACISTPLRCDIVPTVEIESTVHRFNDNRFIRARLCLATDLPRFTVVITNNQM